MSLTELALQPQVDAQNFTLRSGEGVAAFIELQAAMAELLAVHKRPSTKKIQQHPMCQHFFS